MPLNTNFNTSPIFDDFDPLKQYYRILFRPSIPVQARELTQVQTMIQNQIEQMGNWAFNNGDIVSGCSLSDLPNLPYVFLNDFASNGSVNNATFTANSLVNTYVTSAKSNLSARVVASNNGLIANYPNTNVLYLQYLNTGTSGETQFGNSELLMINTVSVSGNTPVMNVYSLANTTANTFASGNAHGVSVSSGVIFINGVFVLVENPTIGLVNTYNSNAGNNVVGFALNENIITENQDSSLYDNAQGFSNYNAPGAWRLQLEPYIISVDPTTITGNTNFNPIAVYNNNSLVLKTSTSNTYQSQLGDAIATTVYDEAGNYVISPFSVDTVSKTANSTYMSARVQPGVGYAQGYKVNLLKTAYADVRRGTDTVLASQQQITINYGNYVSLQEVAGNFDFDQFQSVTLYDTPQKTVTNHRWSSTNPIGNAIGTARIREFEFLSGIPGLNTAQYNLYLFNIVMNSGQSFDNVQAVYYNNNGVIGVGDVASSGLQNGNGLLLFPFGANAVFTLKNNNNNNAEYKFRNKATGILTDTYGNITVSLSASPGGGTDILPYGVGYIPDNVVLEDIIVIPQSNASVTLAFPSTTISTANPYLIGSGTQFLTDFSVGDSVKVNSDVRNVINISNNTFLTVDSNFSTSGSSQTAYRYYNAGKYISLARVLNGNRGVNVVNNSTMIISTGISNSSVSTTVYYNTLRTNANPAQKIINKNRFVNINTSSNPKGPWCLGISDISGLSKVYAASNTFSVNGIDLSNEFVIDTGQRDDHYDLGYLYLKSPVDLSSTPYLTVMIDYYTSNTTSGVGFYTVDSYPVDDLNVANTNAVTTINLPLYVSSAGTQIPLRNVVDFRYMINSTANNTGSVDTSNTVAMNMAVAFATVNPSNNATIKINASGARTPSFSSNFQSDYQYYLPRYDMFYFTNNGSLKIKEGVPSLTPQSPLAPSTGMPVAILNIPPFPSLTTDQLDTVTNINQTAYTLTRESKNPVLITLITNRRYNMSDIGVLDTRITNLEQLLSLTLLESSASQLTITNSQGENAFKNGIFADPFTSHSLGDISNQEYRIAIDSTNAVARPYIRRVNIPLTMNAVTSTTQKTGRVITLPFTEVSLVSQLYATEYMSAAPLAYRWNGSMNLYPSYSNNQDTVTVGSVQVTINNATAWQQFAASPFGTIYGDWNTTTSVNTAVVSTGSVNTYTGYANPYSGYNFVGLAENELGVQPGTFSIGSVVYQGY